MAMIGRNAAIFDFGWRQLKGRMAWILWALIHVYLLVAFEKRVVVSVQWFWRWLTHAVQGDFGTSVTLNQEVATAVGQRIEITASLIVGSMLISLVVGVLFAAGLITGGGWENLHPEGELERRMASRKSR